MDSNKKCRLDEIGYKIQPCCAICQHSKFISHSAFGLCMLSDHKYTHLKHSGEDRNLSVNIFGWCPKFASSHGKIFERINQFSVFIEEEDGTTRS